MIALQYHPATGQIFGAVEANASAILNLQQHAGHIALFPWEGTDLDVSALRETHKIVEGELVEKPRITFRAHRAVMTADGVDAVDILVEGLQRPTHVKVSKMRVILTPDDPVMVFRTQTPMLYVIGLVPDEQRDYASEPCMIEAE
jgi:hypothetical protein